MTGADYTNLMRVLRGIESNLDQLVKMQRETLSIEQRLKILRTELEDEERTRAATDSSNRSDTQADRSPNKT